MEAKCKIENSLFNEKMIEAFIDKYNDVLVVNSDDGDPIQFWIDKLNNNELENEKSNYINFFEIILKQLLGYELSDIHYEDNIGQNRPVEFVFKRNEEEFAIVELKGTNTKDLNKRYNREQSAIEQATNYASLKESTKWAIVSNYDEFRLFNPNYREKYISFKFEQLTCPDVLKKFLLTFGKFSLIEKDIPQTLLKQTQIIEHELEDEFYKLFSETRLMLIKEIEYSSEQIDRAEAVRLSQLILNRFIFLCFAEDLQLIPNQTTTDVLLTPIRHKNLFEFTMFDRLNELFRFADKGNVERGIPTFNGGLFKENLRHLEIRDKIDDLNFFNDCFKKWKFEEKYEEIKNLFGVYKNTLNPIYKNLLLISSFDFGSELSVNILGHIFENSIGDIEELKDEKTERRKKDGVFYTPDDITSYICKNTIIPYLSLSGTANTVNDLIAEYEINNELDILDKKLKDIKIIDIACGSGAFLNKAVDILFDIHKAYHDSKYSDNTTLDKFFDDLNSRKEIIVNNIFGVDLNEESIEITKLSLFLKLATSKGIKQGFTLPNLDKNIKCGNSIVNDKTIDDKAFNWETEFDEVLSNGGFDIIIGNPPYVRQEKIKEIKPHLKEHYDTYTGVADLYVYFFEKGLNILKENGFLGFICSNKFLKTDYGKNLRELILKNNIRIFVDYTGKKLFDATVDTCTMIIKKEFKENNAIFVNDEFYMKQSHLNSNGFNFIEENVLNLRNKIFSQSTLIKDLDISIKRGILTGANNVFIIDENTKNQLINLDYKNNEVIEPLLRGRDLHKWKIEYDNLYLIHTYDNLDVEEKYPTLYEYLEKFKEVLEKRGDKGEHWYNLRPCAYDDKFKENKIIYSTISTEPCFVYDENKYFLNNSAYIIHSDTINLKYLTVLLNSNLLFWYFKDIGTDYGGKAHPYRKIYIEQLPIKLVDENKESIIVNTFDKLIRNNETLKNEITNFKKWIKRTFEIDKLSAKLENYYELNLDEFLKELKKKKVDTKSRKNQELLETEFNNSIDIIKPLQNEIKETENKINQLVYELYDLNPEEIDIIENSLN